jgi:hypothetical protein
MSFIRVSDTVVSQLSRIARILFSTLPRKIPVLWRRKHDFADIACPVGLAKDPKIAVKAIWLVALGIRSSSGMLAFV